MLFLSVQPDDSYFIWQLEIQLRNFISFGIIKDQIHIVIGYNTTVGLKENFKNFIENNTDFAQFFIYPDTRINPSYTSSIRPHLLEKHWEVFPGLQSEIIFYHDSDILLTRKWNLEDILLDKINYVSDTKSYLDSKYILSHSNQNIFEQMCDIVGINSESVVKNDIDSGGAQYILKNISIAFWEKVYRDSESIFELLTNFNSEEMQKAVLYNDYKPSTIEAWCADMWAILWNLWHHHQEVKIHSELDFSWPTESIEQWSNKAIQHYAGLHTDKKNFFYKRDYIHYPPWYDDNLDSIPDISCSYCIVQLIKSRRKELDDCRYILNNIALKFVHIENSTINNYISKYFESSKYNCDKIVNIKLYDTLVLPTDVIISLDKAFQNYAYTKIFFENVYKIDQLFGIAFNNILDADILILNKDKFKLTHPLTVYIDDEINDNNILTIHTDVFLI